MFKIKKEQLAFYVATAFVLLSFSFASLHKTSPFLLGGYLALMLTKVNPYIATAMYIVFSIIPSFHIFKLLGSISVALIMLVGYLIGLKLKKPVRYVDYIFAFAAAAIQVPFMIAERIPVVSIVIELFFSVMFLFVCKCFLRPIYLHKLKYKLIETEVLSGIAVIIAASLGLTGLYIFDFPVMPFFAAALLCFLSCIGGKALITAGIAVGIGMSLYHYDVYGIAVFSVTALIMSMFVSAPRILAAFSSVLGFVMVTYYFNVEYAYGLWWFLSVAAGGLVTLLIPKSLTVKVKEYFYGDFNKAAVRFAINRSRRDMGNRLLNVGDVFKEMGDVLNGGEPIIDDKLIEELGDKLNCQVCAGCAKASECAEKGVKYEFRYIMNEAVEKGRLSVIDMPKIVSADCIKVASILNKSCDMAAEYNAAKVKFGSDLALKRELSAGFENVSDIVYRLSDLMAKPVNYVSETEKKLVEELNYCNVICSEAIILTGEQTNITLIAKSDCLNKELVEKVVSRMLTRPYGVTKIDEGVMMGWSIVYLEASPKFEVVFSASNLPNRPGEKSGDTHSFIKINSTKFMMALCDGMGSGDQAEKLSNTAISLIESFYKAGFSSEVVLSSVNKFLTAYNQDRFIALDIVVIDLNEGKADIIKIGSPTTYVKTRESTFKIEGSALPLGIVEEMRPFITSVALKGGETIVLSSDGVTDAFKGDEYPYFISGFAGDNVSMLSEAIIEKSLVSAGGKPRDDMSVAAARIFERF